MITHQEQRLSLYFGQKKDFQGEVPSDDFETYCLDLCSEYNLDNLTLLRQTHGIEGHCITYKQNPSPKLHVLEQAGDYLFTQQHKIGLAVSTADCLPIIFYDSRNDCIAVVHSGWRGSTQNIVEYVLKELIATYASNHENLQLFFGPSAGSCCYEVETSFLDNLAQFHLEEEQKIKIIFESQGKWYFDNAQLTLHLLKQLGIKEQQVSRFYNHCTIHNKEYHSYRRDGDKAGRQITLASLM